MSRTHSVSAPKIAYVADTRKGDTTALFNRLSGLYPPVPLPDADVVIAIGGDGTILRAMHDAHNKSGTLVYGLVPDESNSTGFLLNPLGGNTDIPARLAASHIHDITPLELQIHYNTTAVETRIAFSAISVIRDSAQAALLHVTDGVEKAPTRFMGNGLVFYTPLGSTGLPYSMGARAVSLRDQFYRMRVDAAHFTTPLKHRRFSPNVTVTLIPPSSYERRPLRFDIDSLTHRPDAAKGEIAKIVIGLSPHVKLRLGLDEPSLQKLKRLLPTQKRL